MESSLRAAFTEPSSRLKSALKYRRCGPKNSISRRRGRYLSLGGNAEPANGESTCRKMPSFSAGSFRRKGRGISGRYRRGTAYFLPRQISRKTAVLSPCGSGPHTAGTKDPRVRKRKRGRGGGRRGEEQHGEGAAQWTILRG